MAHQYKPRGVCSRRIAFDLTDGVVRNVSFEGGCSGNTQGIARLVEPMALAGAACGADGLMIEVHNDPIHALCDGAQSLTPEQFLHLSRKIAAVRQAVQG